MTSEIILEAFQVPLPELSGFHVGHDVLLQLYACLCNATRSSVHTTGTVCAHKLRPNNAGHCVSHFQTASIHIVVTLMSGAAEYGLSIGTADQVERNQQAADERSKRNTHFD